VSLRALQIARTAMAAQSTVMDAVAHNVANVNTPGYARRRVLLSAIPGETGVLSVVSGRGVQATTVQRLGDRLLEAQINVETGELGRQEVYAAGVDELETIVAGTDGQGLQGALNDLFDAFSEVAADPTSDTARQRVVSTGQTLCDAMRDTASSLNEAVTRNDEQLAANVSQINSLARQVAELNAAIGRAGGADGSPDLADQRGVALKELASLTGAVGITQDNGYVDVVIGGTHLVQGDTAARLSMTSQAVPGHPSLHTYGVQVTTSDGVTTDGTTSITTGELAGRLALGERLNEAISDTSTFAARVAEELNTAHAGGYGLSDGAAVTPPDRDLFTFSTTGPDDWAVGIAVNADIVADPDLLKAASRPGESGNGDIALALEALRTTSGTAGEATLIQTQAAWLAELGQEVDLAGTQADSQSAITDALQARYDVNAGVSLDEEAISLSEAERAYAAAQRVATVALEMLDTVLALVD
jgi:flagellar hook-associated protein 1